MLLAYFKYLILPLLIPLILGIFLTSEIVRNYNQPNNYKYSSSKTKRTLKNIKIGSELKEDLPPT